MSIQESLRRIMQIRESEIRHEQFSPEEQLVLRTYRDSAVGFDYQVVEAMKGENFAPGYLNDTVRIVTSLDERGFLHYYRDQAISGVRELTPEGKKAADLIAKTKGAYEQPVVVNVPISRKK